MLLAYVEQASVQEVLGGNQTEQAIGLVGLDDRGTAQRRLCEALGDLAKRVLRMDGQRSTEGHLANKGVCVYIALA
jgi:hypothetical protein